MTKRSLIIIIVMLVLVNMLAALYYLGARMESEGRGIGSEAGDSAAAEAEMVSIATAPDVFGQWTSRNKTYVSEVTDNSSRQYVSALSVKMRLPESVNGNDSLPSLYRALARAAFGGDPISLPSAVNAFLSEPHWGTAVVTGYSSGGDATHSGLARTVSTTVTISPRMTSQRLLVMAAERQVVTMDDTTATVAYVHYDRLLQRVLERNDILQPQTEQQLLALINEKIVTLNERTRLKLTAAVRVPASFRAQRTGLLFCFHEGELTSPKHGSIDVLVDYKVLGPCLTTSFKHLLWHNADYRNL